MKKKTSETLPKEGDHWTNLVTGQRYVYREKLERWVPTGEFPFGEDPMGFINNNGILE